MKIKEAFKKFSLLPQGLRYKLLIAFSLMSIIPLLIVGYLFNSLVVLGETISIAQISVVVVFCIIIAWMGLLLAKGIIERVVEIALETKLITEGHYDRKISVDTSDEIGQIGESINFLTKKIRSDITELRDYQGKMKDINMDIHKRISVLSNLLQVGELISSSVSIDHIIELVLSKLSQLYEGGFAVLYLADSIKNPLTLQAASNLRVGDVFAPAVEKGTGFLGNILLKRKHVVIDASSKFSAEDQGFRERYKYENLVAFPMILTKGGSALLVIGNNIKNFTYTNDDIDMIKVFTEQIAIAIENDILIKKAKELEIKDELTGLYNETYILMRLKEEIQRSVVSQRPCAFILVDIDGFREYSDKKGAAQTDVALKKVAHFIGEVAGPLGKAGRIDHNLFALVMPEVNKKGALEVAEKARSGIGKLVLSPDETDRVTVSCGVSENPIDGSDSEHIFKKANSSLSEAKKKGKNVVVG
ncbi:diguanylate cyclase domain-containing protein [Candidatus Omnitrophota bacterium]